MNHTLPKATNPVENGSEIQLEGRVLWHWCGSQVSADTRVHTIAEAKAEHAKRDAPFRADVAQYWAQRERRQKVEWKWSNEKERSSLEKKLWVERLSEFKTSADVAIKTKEATQNSRSLLHCVLLFICLPVFGWNSVDRGLRVLYVVDVCLILVSLLFLWFAWRREHCKADTTAEAKAVYFSTLRGPIKRSSPFLAGFSKGWAQTNVIAVAQSTTLGALLFDEWTIVERFLEPKTAIREELEWLFDKNCFDCRVDFEPDPTHSNFAHRVQLADFAHATGGYFVRGLRNSLVHEQNWNNWLLDELLHDQIIARALFFYDLALVRDVYLKDITDAVFLSIPGTRHSALIQCIWSDIEFLKAAQTLPALFEIAPKHVMDKMLCETDANGQLPFHVAIEEFHECDSGVDADYLRLLLPPGDDYTLDINGTKMMEFTAQLYADRGDVQREQALTAVWAAVPNRLKVRELREMPANQRNLALTDIENGDHCAEVCWQTKAPFISYKTKYFLCDLFTSVRA